MDKKAKEKGVMFDPLTISHDACINRIIEIANTITPEQVAKAFLSSLSTRRLDWRSGIGSYFIAKLSTLINICLRNQGISIRTVKLCIHYTCKICKNLKYGVIGDEHYLNEDLNVLNYRCNEEAVDKYFGKYLKQKAAVY